MKYIGDIMHCNIPNLNGRVYPKDVMEKAVEEYMKHNKNDIILGELSRGDDVATLERMNVHLKDVSHKLTDIYFEGNNLVGELELLPTENGKLVSEIGIDNFGFEVVCSGEFEDGEAKKIILHHIDLVPKDKCAWEGTGISELPLN